MTSSTTLDSKPLVWVHACSVGEVRAITPLVKRLLKEHLCQLLVTTTTKTGLAEAKRTLAEAHVHKRLPIDPIAAFQVLRFKPKLVLISETDFWPLFLQACKKVRAKIVVINGKVSERSAKRLLRFSFLARPFLAPIDHFCVQGALYHKRFLLLGIPEHKLSITGNLKLSFKPTLASLSLPQKLNLVKGDLILTLGSIHDPEEALFLDYMPTLFASFPTLKVIIVPRHPERFEKVAKLIEEKKLPFARYTDPKSSNLILIDAMGLLNACYALSTLAFVGGSFTPNVGGHNLAEPAFFNVPVLYGPHLHAQPDLAHLFSACRAGIALTRENLYQKLFFLLSSEKERALYSKRASEALLACADPLELSYEKVLAQKPFAC